MSPKRPLQTYQRHRQMHNQPQDNSKSSCGFWLLDWERILLYRCNDAVDSNKNKTHLKGWTRPFEWIQLQEKQSKTGRDIVVIMLGSTDKNTYSISSQWLHWFKRSREWFESLYWGFQTLLDLRKTEDIWVRNCHHKFWSNLVGRTCGHGNACGLIGWNKWSIAERKWGKIGRRAKQKLL